MLFSEPHVTWYKLCKRSGRLCTSDHVVLPFDDRTYEPSDLSVIVNVLSSSIGIPGAMDGPVRNVLLLLLPLSDIGVYASFGLSDFIEARKFDKLQQSTNLKQTTQYTMYIHVRYFKVFSCKCIHNLR